MLLFPDCSGTVRNKWDRVRWEINRTKHRSVRCHCTWHVGGAWQGLYQSNMLKCETLCTSAFISFAFSIRKETLQRKIKPISGLLHQSSLGEMLTCQVISLIERTERRISEPSWCFITENNEVNILAINWRKELPFFFFKFGKNNLLVFSKILSLVFLFLIIQFLKVIFHLQLFWNIGFLKIN